MTWSEREKAEIKGGKKEKKLENPKYLTNCEKKS